MAYDFDEEEQIESIKNWWQKNGLILTIAIVLVLGSFTAWQYWQNYLIKQSAHAVKLYEEQQKAIQSQDFKKTLRAAQDIQNRFPRTAYAQMAGLAAANLAFANNDLSTTETQLRWVLEKGHYAEYQVLAKLHLSSVLLDQKQYSKAWGVLSGEFPQAFSALVANNQGDILLAQNKTSEARRYYEMALKEAEKVQTAESQSNQNKEQKSAFYQMVALKIAALR